VRRVLFSLLCGDSSVITVVAGEVDAKKNALDQQRAFTEQEPSLLFSKLSQTTFLDKDFRELICVWTRMLWLYLVSSPKNMAIPGLMAITVDEMACDLAWAAELGDRARSQLETSMQELIEKKFKKRNHFKKDGGEP
jgi:hypothetical protein